MVDRKILLMTLEGLLSKMKQQDRDRTCCIMTIEEVEEVVVCMKIANEQPVK